MTWAMVEAYGFDLHAGAPGPSGAAVIDAVRETLRMSDASGRDRLRLIGEVVGQLESTLAPGSSAVSAQGEPGHRVDAALTTIRGLLARASAAQVLERTWGLPAPARWSAEAVIERISTLLEGTIFPGLGQRSWPDDAAGSATGAAPHGHRCSVLIQERPGRLRRRDLATCLRGIDAVLARAPVADDRRDALASCRRLAERLLEMRYVERAMKRSRVRGKPRRQLKQAIRRQSERLAAAAARLEWPPRPPG